MKLLIADDEKLIREGLEKLNWKSVGITQVMVCDNGIDALKIIKNTKPEIILTDIKMPGFSGLELLEEIHKNTELDIRLILLSGYGTFEYAMRAMHNQVFEYLLKPSSPSQILETVCRAVDSYNADKKEELDKNLVLLSKENIEKDTMKLILKYLEENYMSNITLQSLSEFIHFTPNYVSKYIKKETNYNFVKILTIIRMVKAAELISNSNLKIYEICERVGITDQRYFSQLFLKTFGYSPLEYRKRNQGKKVELNFMDYME